MDKRNELYLKKEFANIYPALKIWGERVDSLIIYLLTDLIQEKKIQILPSFRIKEIDKFISKVLTRKRYEDPIIETSDKVGTRVVILNTGDFSIIDQKFLKCKDWEISKDRDWELEAKENPRIFDYQSWHFVVTPLEDIDGVDRNKLKCEIQVRTLLQHAYAEVSHDHVYKGAFRGDSNVLRKLAKSMALMEATDEYFNVIFSLISDHSKYEPGIFSFLREEFVKIFPELDVNTDPRLFDLFFPLYEGRAVTSEAIGEFIRTEIASIKLISNLDWLLVRHPIVLLLLYYINFDLEYIIEHWPSDLYQLEQLCISVGVSFDH